ncbi:MAG TPA: MarR family transcriptional regulator, partial [Lachnoclostridium sp.]|nr:MarR family transcriptional regulator [Lachnoclostridium sp.]
TYTQYIAMMILWDKGELSVKELGKCLYLDSGTLTPLLKKLEQKGYVERHRGTEDERTLLVHATDEGMALRERLLEVPEKVGGCVVLTPEEAKQLYGLLYKVLGGLDT